MMERVLCVRTSKFRELGYFEGFSDRATHYMHNLLVPSNLIYIAKDDAEQDPNYKQIIPYVVFQYTDPYDVKYVFKYRRSESSGESRLVGDYSIGVGGHINSEDEDESPAYFNGLMRELREEVDIGSTTESFSPIGLINDDSNDVGKVHLGIVHLYEISSPAIHAKEDCLQDAGLQQLSRIQAREHMFENWSQIVLKEYFDAQGKA